MLLMIQKVSVMKWKDFIHKKVMHTYVMNTSTITDGPYSELGVSHGYIYYGKIYFEKDYGEEPTFAASGNGGVWSSADELWKYEKAIRQFKFLDSEWTQKSRTVYNHSNW